MDCMSKSFQPFRVIFIFSILIYSIYPISSFAALLQFSKGKVQVERKGMNLRVKLPFKLIDQDKIRVGKKSLAIVKSRASTVKISELSTYILDLSEPEILSGTLSKGALVVQFLRSKLSKIKKTKKSGPEKTLTIKTRTASIGVRGTKFFTYSGASSGSILTVEHGVVDFKGNKQKKFTQLEKDMSSLTNENSEVLRPRKFGYENKINWEIDDSENGKLEHDKELYSQLEKLWKMYKEEQVKAWKEQKTNMNAKWNNMNDTSEINGINTMDDMNKMDGMNKMNEINKMNDINDLNDVFNN